LELSDEADIEAITGRFLPYSDFNFVSMWSYDLKGEMRIAELNGNLVVRFSDYLTEEPLYSFIGDAKVTETAQALLELSGKEGLEQKLQLVPEVTAKLIDPGLLSVEEERNHFDYILSLEKLGDFEQSRLNGHASFKRRFLEQYPQSEAKILELNTVEHRVEVMSLTTIWIENKAKQTKSFLNHLEEAVKRFLVIHDLHNQNLVSIGISLEGKLIAFTINELVNADYAVCHFMKGDNSHKGIYSHLVSESAKALLQRGCKYVNFEQDLGLLNLRQSKKTFEPVDFLKKYSVTSL